MGTVAQHGPDIEAFLKPLQGGGLLVDNSDVVLFVGKMLSECAADLSCPEDYDFHRPLDPPNDPRTP